VRRGDEVAFSIGAGTTLDRVTRDAVVAFESDGLEPAAGGHGSVAVTGMARHLSEGDNGERAVLERLPGWDPSRRRWVVRVSTEFMSGRRSG
jgi:Pyridoxamine 5'-phosphate oxidase